MSELRNSTVEVRRVGASLGAEVSGVDLAQPLDVSQIEAVNGALAEHEVLVFRDQDITDYNSKVVNTTGQGARAVSARFCLTKPGCRGQGHLGRPVMSVMGQ